MTPDDPHQAILDHLTARIRYLEAELRRAWEQVDWKDEQIRGYRRAIERLGRGNADGQHSR